jgi:hypothetical protein
MMNSRKQGGDSPRVCTDDMAPIGTYCCRLLPIGVDYWRFLTNCVDGRLVVLIPAPVPESHH